MGIAILQLFFGPKCARHPAHRGSQGGGGLREAGVVAAAPHPRDVLRPYEPWGRRRRRNTADTASQDSPSYNLTVVGGGVVRIGVVVRLGGWDHHRRGILFQRGREVMII